VWAVDVNERAVGLCAANALAAGVSNVHAVTVPASGEPTAALPDDVSFGAIYSNPPIRIGKAALHDLLASWLGRLAPGGHAYLVVQKHLGSDSLARWLDEQGWPTERIGSRKPGHRNFPADRRGVVFSGRTREPIVRGLVAPGRT
jgi:16S rRNA (guanine1207-N2)-methyltransferase